MSQDGAASPRRTFAIISHPDAGKTTLTEKLLLFGGAINLAGQVKAKGERRNRGHGGGRRLGGRRIGSELLVHGALHVAGKGLWIKG